MFKSKLMIILYIIIGLISLVLLTALFIKKDYKIDNEIVICKPDSMIFDYLKYFNNHRNFNVWLMKDPAMKATFKGNDGEKGSIYSYEGNRQVGGGEQELTELIPYKKVGIELRFIKPLKSTSDTPYFLERINDSTTKVKWVMKGKMNYPFNFALLFINMDNFLGKDLQKSLENLKFILEK